MSYVIILSLIFGGIIVYIFLNPAEKIQKNETRELETLDQGYGENIERFLSESKIHSGVIERYFYLKHKYNLTKTKSK